MAVNSTCVDQPQRMTSLLVEDVFSGRLAEKSFSVAGPRAWNSLPSHERRQTDVRQHHCLMPPPPRRGHNKPKTKYKLN